MLFRSTVSVIEGAGQSINVLTTYFAKDDLPVSRTAIAQRILAELRGLKRLCPSSLEEEFKMLRRLGNQLVLGQGKYLSHEALISAFMERSKRLVTHEPLLQFMSEVKTQDEKVERLLVVEENIVGAENKRTLSTFILPLITSNGFEPQLLSNGTPVQRLRRIAELQERALRSGFQEIQKNQLAAALDLAAVRLEERLKLIVSFETKFVNPIERAHALLKLFAAGVFTQGELLSKVKKILAVALVKPGFLPTYLHIAESARTAAADRKTLLGELTNNLQSAGFTPEDISRALAA